MADKGVARGWRARGWQAETRDHDVRRPYVDFGVKADGAARRHPRGAHVDHALLRDRVRRPEHAHRSGARRARFGGVFDRATYATDAQDLGASSPRARAQVNVDLTRRAENIYSRNLFFGPCPCRRVPYAEVGGCDAFIEEEVADDATDDVGFVP